MTSATMRRAKGASQGEGYWMIVFAVALLVTVGFFNMIDGIAAIANSHVFIANAHYVVGDLRVWGRVVLILPERPAHRRPDHSRPLTGRWHQRCGALGARGQGRGGPGERTDARRAGQSPGQG